MTLRLPVTPELQIGVDQMMAGQKLPTSDKISGQIKKRKKERKKTTLNIKI